MQWFSDRCAVRAAPSLASPPCSCGFVDARHDGHAEKRHGRRAIKRVAVIGCGTIGASWTALFMAHGYNVAAQRSYGIAADDPHRPLNDSPRRGGLAQGKGAGSADLWRQRQSGAA
ncbi:3-hydroxyacyl-CoA dehydrogenase NAD-binding domain-containing protein [Rhizobium terrae]|uniref:3-hydroxyacyl-CoA dehydrogenase NAD-binding domain-containing protein n=1 Tax=Rhizobium terrae TaxID=2171756 RepID=UPI001D030529|nr:3-hydroxyacyl-CoA dehydrogenase NAD-binding domain-containing protein [Rhizobium terrae]